MGLDSVGGGFFGVVGCIVVDGGVRGDGKSGLLWKGWCERKRGELVVM